MAGRRAAGAGAAGARGAEARGAEARSAGRGRAALAAALALVAVVAFWVRWSNGLPIPESGSRGGEAAWFTRDPDSLYHARRLERALAEGGRVAPRDPLLGSTEFAHPDGGPIPWPATYTRVLHLLTAPFAPQEPRARERYAEQAVASWPLRFASATSVLVALVAGLLAGPLAALGAGLYHATLFASVRYSFLGMGDHHAWVSLLLVAWWGLASVAFARGALERGASGAWAGAACGVLAGLALGSWVPSLMLVVLFQGTLGVAVLAHGRRPRLGLAAFGLAFHGVAAAVILPEVLASPWGPFEVVNLSWFHPLELGLGAVVFVPLLGIAPGSPGSRRYGWVVGAVLSVLALVLLLTPGGAGLRDGFTWAAGAGLFMGRVSESQPLLGGAVGGWGPVAKWCGAGVFLLPLAWLAALRARGDGLLPWVVGAPFLAGLALAQRRFAEVLGGPLAVLLGWGLGRAARTDRGRGLPPILWGLAALSLPLLANPHGPRVAWNRTRLGQGAFVEAGSFPAARAQRELARWLREHVQDSGPDSGPGSRPGAVLAQWDQGHLLEWVARRPTVATNFGTYLGREAFLDPWRFLLAADEERAEGILEARGASHLFLAADWDRNLDSMVRALGVADPREGLVWRLLPGLAGGANPGEQGPQGVGFLRLVALTTVPSTGSSTVAARPAGWVFERVRGAWLEARGLPGSELMVELELRHPALDAPLPWVRRARADGEGRLRLRVPYTTETNNGDVHAVGPLRWRLGEERGEIHLPEEAVLDGRTIFLR